MSTQTRTMVTRHGAAGSRAALVIPVTVAVTLTLSTLPLATAQLEPQTVRGWQAYVAAAEARMRQELASSTRFLALDFDRDAAAERRQILAGDVVIRRVEAVDDEEGASGVPGAMVHDWRGAIFIPDTSVRVLLRRLADHVPPSPDVLRAAILERTPDHLRVFLRVQRTRIVTVVYDTEYAVTLRRLGPMRATSTSIATRISEIDRPGTPQERALAPGDDHGYLWRLNAYWRYEEVPGGVIAECESISLSRTVPFLLRPVAAPIINSTARTALEQALVSLRADAAGRLHEMRPAPSPVR